MAEGERNDRGRQVVAWLLAGVVVAGGAVGVGSVVTDDEPLSVSRDAPSSPFGDATADSVEPGRDAAAWSPAPWEGARLDGDRLTLYFTSSRSGEPDEACSREYEAVVKPTDETMVVTLRGRAFASSSPDQACPEIGYQRSITVDLPELLRGRTVVEGGSGEARTISRAARQLEPSWLPAGYDFSTGRVESGADSYVDRRVWTHQGPARKRLIIEQGGETVDELGTPGHEPVVLGRPTIRGRPAAVWRSEGFNDSICVSWIEDYTGHRVCSHGPAGDLLPTDQLIRVADQLREPGNT